MPLKVWNKFHRNPTHVAPSLLSRVSQCLECKMPLGNLAKVFGPTIVGHSRPNIEPMYMLQETRVQAPVCKQFPQGIQSFVQQLFCCVTSGPSPVALNQGFTKVVSHSQGRVDYPIRQADFSSHSPDGQAWLSGSNQVSRDAPILPWVRYRVWVGTWLELVLALTEGWVDIFHSVFHYWLNPGLVQNSHRQVKLKCRLPKGFLFVKPVNTCHIWGYTQSMIK